MGISELKAKLQSRLTTDTNEETQEEIRKKITKVIIWMCFFFGVSSFMLIGDYMSIPHWYNIDNYSKVTAFFDAKYINVYHDYWKICIGDGKITQIEYIIIMLFMLWGMLRLIDLLRFMERLKSF